MKGYIGERSVQVQETPFASYTQTERLKRELGEK